MKRFNWVPWARWLAAVLVSAVLGYLTHQQVVTPPPPVTVFETTAPR